MKKNHKSRRTNLKIHRRPYPNAADPAYFKDKLVDIMLSLVSTMGIITLFLFLVTV